MMYALPVAVHHCVKSVSDCENRTLLKLHSNHILYQRVCLVIYRRCGLKVEYTN